MRPDKISLVVTRHSRVGDVPSSFYGRNDRAVVDDEIAPYLLKGVSKSRRRRGCVDSEIGSQIRTMVCRRDRVLILPNFFPRTGKGICEPVARTCECDLGVEIESTLFLACGELGLI